MAYENLTEDENALMNHWMMWGSAGYPIKNFSGRWTWEFRSIKFPMMRKTKKESVADFERYIDALRDRVAGRLAGKAVANG